MPHRLGRRVVPALAFALAAISGERASRASDPPPRLPPPPPPSSSANGSGTSSSSRATAKPATSSSTSSGGGVIGSSGGPSESSLEPSHDATPPPETRPFIGAMLGFSSDDLNFGLGVRGGKTFDNRLYVGGTFVYHFGTSQSVSVPGPGTTVTASTSSSALYLGPEGGYDFSIKPVVIRPYAGLGVASLHTSTSGAAGVPATSGSASKFVGWIGGTVVYTLPATSFFIAGDLRLVTIPGGPALGIYAFGGVYF